MMKSPLNIKSYIVKYGFVKSYNKNDPFIKTIENLYKTYKTPERLADLYKDIYLSIPTNENSFIGIDQTNPTIGAACLIALAYARYRQRLCCPNKAFLTNIYLYLNEISVRIRLKWRDLFQ